MDSAKHRGGLLIAILAIVYSLPSITVAAETPAPLAIVFPETMQAGASHGVPPGLGFALIASLSDAAVDKQSAKQVEMFRERTPGFDFAAVMRDSLRCVGVAEPRTTCRELLTLPEAKDQKELVARLTEKGITDLVIVNVVPLFSEQRFRVRAFATEMHVTPKALQTTKAYGAIYDSRAPEDLTEAKNPSALADFWRDGTPTRIEREATASAQEIERVLSFLSDKLTPPGDRSTFLNGLPSIKELKAAGRVACRGIPCGDVRVVNDAGPRLWLTNTRLLGEHGTLIVSQDANSARHSANVFLMVVTLDN